MLGNVIKYDFYHIGKRMGIYYLGYLLIAVMTKVLDLLSKNFAILSPLVKIGVGLFVVMSVTLFVYQFIVVIRRVITNTFKNEGYLTGTLPVTKNTLLLSKVFLTAIFTLVSFLVLTLGLAVLFFHEDFFQEMSLFLAPILEVFQITLPVMIAWIIGYTVLVMLNYVLWFSAALSFGHTFDNNKMGMSVVAGVILYMVSQVINVIGILIFGLFHIDVIQMLETNPEMIDMSVMNGLLLFSVGLSLFITAGYYFAAKIPLTKKYNLE